MTQISSLDNPNEYRLGSLSGFPVKLDTEQNLYLVGNRVWSTLRSSMTSTSNIIVIEENIGFPSTGVVKIGGEFIFYESITNNVIEGLVRGFAGTGPMSHSRGQKVELIILADHHNVIRDAIARLEEKTGLQNSPGNRDGNLSERVTYLRNKWWTPRALWFAQPRKGVSPLKVQFVNFSRGFPDSFSWDFGDGTKSTERNPVHTYTEAGLYNVSLRVFSPKKGSNRAYKFGEIEVITEEEIFQPLIWIDVWNNRLGRYVQGVKGRAPLRVRMIDQTLGTIFKRTWSMGDETVIQVNDPFNIEVEHVYENPGEYQPSMFLQVTKDKTLNFRIPFMIEVLE